MDIFEKLFPKNLYHSYVIEGDPDIISIELLKFLEARGEIENSSPDVLCQTYESFTMDDGIQIKNWHGNLGITKNKKICILATKFINREAEHALLKIIEEPAVNTHFFIIIPDSSILLPTIVSRAHIIKIDQSINSDFKKEVFAFIQSSPKDRIDKIALIIKNNKDAENSGQLRYYATSFINEIENVFYQKFKIDKKDKKIRHILEEIQKARGYLSTSGASVKMILEHLALVI